MRTLFNSINSARRNIVASLIAASAVALLPTESAHAWEWSGWGKNVSGSGVIKTETRVVSGFTALALSLPAKVTLVQGAREGISIEADDNLLPLIETVVESGKLRLRTVDTNTNLKTRTLNIIVNVIKLDALAVAGSGDVVAERLKADKFTASIAGSGDVNIVALDAATVKVSIAGSGDFTAGGKTTAFEISIAGSGDVRAGRLEAVSAKVSIAGSGDVTLWAKDELKVSVAGSGDVKYYGDPKVKSSAAGSGSVKRLGNAPS